MGKNKEKYIICYPISGFCYLLLFICFLFLVPFTCYADFEDLGCGARAIGMGNAFTCISDDVSAIYYNPAGLGQLTGWESGSSYSKLHWGLDDESRLGDGFIGYAQPIRIKCSKKEKVEKKKAEKEFSNWGTLGFGWLNLNLIDLYREDTFFISYGKTLPKLFRRSLWAGVNLKLLCKEYRKTLYSENALDDDIGMVTGSRDPVFNKGYRKEGFSTDLGLLYKLGKSDTLKGYYLGLTMTDINQPDMGLKAEERIPLGIKMGVSYRSKKINVALDSNYKNRDLNIYSGAEAWFVKNTLGLRMGIGIGSREYRSVFLGTSYRYKPYLQVDYAFIYPISGIKETSGSHRISLVLRQKGKPKEKKQKVYKKVEKKKKEIISAWFAEGMDFYKRGIFKEAIFSWEKVLKEVPSHRLADKYLQRIRKKLKGRIKEFYEEAEVFYKIGQWSAAIDKWESILDFNSGEQLAGDKINMVKDKLKKYFSLANGLYGKGDYVKAVREWEKILKLYPGYPQTEEGIRKSRVKVKQKTQEGKRRRMIKDYIEKGIKYYKEGEYKMAVEEWEKGLGLDPYNAGCLEQINKLLDKFLKRGSELYDSGEYKAAIEKWRKVLKIKPENKKAKNLIRKVKKELAEKVDIFYKNGTKKYSEGDYLGAISWWERGLKSMPGHKEMIKLCVESHLAQGIFCYRENDLAKAIKHWEKVLRLKPRQEQAVKYLKRARTKQKRLKELEEGR